MVRKRMKVRRRRELQLLCYSTFEDKNDTAFSFKIGIVHFLSMSDYSEEAKHIFETISVLERIASF